MPLRISGLSSGIDTETAIKELMKANRIPLDRLKQKKQTFEWTRDAYREMNTQLTNFRNNKMFNYRLTSTFSPMAVDIEGNKEAVSATAGTSVVEQSFTMNVTALAVAASKYSTTDIRNTPGDATFSSTQKLNTQGAKLGGLNSATYSFTINGTAVSVNTANDSLNDVLNRINRTTNVSAFYDSTTGKVAFVAKNSGLTNGAAGNQANITFADTSGDFLTDVLNINTAANTGADSVAGSNASLTINGMATTRTSNTFEINGLTINLLKTSGGSPSTISVKEDTDKMVDKIKEFIADYNEQLVNIQKKITEPRYRDFDPLTDEEKEALSDAEVERYEKKAMSGLLRRDSILSSLEMKMRSIVNTPVSHGGTKYTTLSSIGIDSSSYLENGKLFLKDEAKLRAAIADKPEQVKAIFVNAGNGDSNTSDVGIATRLYDQVKVSLDNLVAKAGAPSALSDVNSVLGRQLTSLDRDIARKADRLIDMENRYYKMFGKMESAMNQFNSQSAYLGNLISGLQGGK